MKSASKVGRKRRDHITAWGETVVGLSRIADGRWRVIGTHIRFTEPDERKAVERYYQLSGATVEGTICGVPIRARRSDLLSLREEVAQIIQKNEEAFYAVVAEDIRNHPQRVARMTGIEWIEYGPKLKPPVPLPPLSELREFWAENAKCSKLQMKKVRRALDDFMAVTGVQALSEITRTTVHDYEKAITARGDTGKQQFHLITGTRRILRFYARRKAEGEAATAVRDALDALATLDISKPAKSIDPRPIEVEDWNKLLAAADDQDRAMLLLMLNGSFYIGEVTALRWSDINFKTGCLVTNRQKTGKCIRCCVIWRETIEALERLTRRDDAIFYAYNGLPIKVCGLQRRWQRLALRAGLATERLGACKKKIINCQVTASQVRDGAYTAAAGSPDVPERFCRLLNGHSCGIADHYVKRNPMMVKPCTDAIYRAYFNTADVGKNTKE